MYSSLLNSKGSHPSIPVLLDTLLSTENNASLQLQYGVHTVWYKFQFNRQLSDSWTCLLEYSTNMFQVAISHGLHLLK